MERFEPAEKGGDICQTLFGGAPENGMFARIRNLERLLGHKSDQAIVACQPILRKHADVDVNTDCCAADADGICAIL